VAGPSDKPRDLGHRAALHPAEAGVPPDRRIRAFLDALAAAVARLILAEIRDENRPPRCDVTAVGSPSDTH